MKKIQFEFTLEMLTEKIFYLKHRVERYKDDEYIFKAVNKHIKELEYVIKLVELQNEVNKIK